MAIIKNAISFGSGFNITAQGPIDSRMRVPKLADLTTVWGTEAPAYAGMIVVVNEEDKAYVLKTIGFNEITGAPIAADPSVLDNWKPIGSNEVLSANTYAAAKALATEELLGSLIYVSTDTDEGTKGFYIVSGDKDIQKLGTAPATGDLSSDVANLKSTVGNAESGLVKDVADLQTAVSEIDVPVTDVTVNGVSVLENGIASVVIPEVDFSEVNAAIDKKVDKVDGSRLITNAEGTKLEGIAEGAQVNVIEKIIFNGTEIVVDSQEKTAILNTPADYITSIANDEKILSVNGGKLGSTLSLNYYTGSDDEGKVVYEIQLVGKESEVLSRIDAKSFVKDGMLHSVELKKNPEGQLAGTYLMFTWNSESGITDPMYVPVTDLIDVYSAGNGLVLNGKTFGIEIKSGEEFLEVTESGLATKGISDAITVAKNAVVGTPEDLDTAITIHGVKKYAGNYVNALESAVSEALKGKVDVSGYNEFVINTNNAIGAIKVSDVDTSESAGVKLTKSESGVIGVSVTTNTLASNLVGETGTVGPVSGVSVKLGQAITDGTEAANEVISATTSVHAAIQTLAGQIQAAVAGGITAIDGGEYITVGGTATAKTLALNTAKVGKYLVAEGSALKADEATGKLTIE